MTLTRRAFVTSGMRAAALLALPRPLLVRLGGPAEPVPPIEDPRLKTLALRALEAARSAGATYADVRLTHTRWRGGTPNEVRDAEAIAVGVRALADGYWGFAASPTWSPEEMVRLGREAVHQARANGIGGTRAVTLAAAPPVADGHWVMPVATDPFDVSPFEIQDVLRSLEVFTTRFGGAGVMRNSCDFSLQEKAFASSEGSYCTQRTYSSAGVLDIQVDRQRDGARDGLGLDCLTPAGLGWELYRTERLPLIRPHSLREAIRRLVEEIKEDMALPVKPVEVGRYDTALDAWTMSELVGETLGRATQLDRAMGYEANAGGTSFLGDPATMLGGFQVGAPLLTVTGDRSTAGAAATVKWDDEGVEPDAFPIVKDGLLTDYQTTRESATWLADYYAKTGRPVRSHGCAAAPSAVEAPLQHPPNLTLVAGQEAHDFDALVAGVRQGIAVKRGRLDMDFQGASGLLTGRFYEVKNGKRVARLAAAGILFRTPELWKSLLGLGGGGSARRYGHAAAKGQPPQATAHSVTAVPSVAKQLTVIDPMRKA
jgi:TldD protein